MAVGHKDLLDKEAKNSQGSARDSTNGRPSQSIPIRRSQRTRSTRRIATDESDNDDETVSCSDDEDDSDSDVSSLDAPVGPKIDTYNPAHPPVVAPAIDFEACIAGTIRKRRRAEQKRARND